MPTKDAAKPETPLWEAAGSEKAQGVRDLFSSIAPHYDRMNRIMSMGLDRSWRRRTVASLRLKHGDPVLDLCCGTGDMTAEILRIVGSGARVVGLDDCAPMLDVARQKMTGVEWLQGDACALPFGSDEFAGVTVGWGLRNVHDLSAAFAEAFRVLRPGGRFASIDMAVPRSPFWRAVTRPVFKHGVPTIARLFGHGDEYAYLPESAQRFADRETQMGMMQRAGFVDVRTQDLMFGNLCIHVGQKP